MYRGGKWIYIAVNESTGEEIICRTQEELATKFKLVPSTVIYRRLTGRVFDGWKFLRKKVEKC